MKKVYLAGPCDSDNRTFMVEAAKCIRQRNNEYTVYCPWELKIENAWDYSQEEWAKMVFDKDVEAIKECDIFIMVSVGRKSTAGTNWEQGFAYGLNKPIYVIQITEEPTSLMTFCGCSGFLIVDKKIIRNAIDAILNVKDHSLKGNWVDQVRCKTVLT